MRCRYFDERWTTQLRWKALAKQEASIRREEGDLRLQW